MVNNVVLVGRVTKEIEKNLTNNGTEVVRFTVAVNRNRKNQNGTYDADFISCVAFGQSANFMSMYIKKGYLLSVVGRLQTGHYQNQQGQRVYTTDVIVENLSNLEPRRDNTSYNGFSNNTNGNFNNGSNFQSSPENQQQNYMYNNDNNANPVTDDDLPF